MRSRWRRCATGDAVHVSVSVCRGPGPGPGAPGPRPRPRHTEIDTDTASPVAPLRSLLRTHTDTHRHTATDIDRHSHRDTKALRHSSPQTETQTHADSHRRRHSVARRTSIPSTHRYRHRHSVARRTSTLLAASRHESSCASTTCEDTHTLVDLRVNHRVASPFSPFRILTRRLILWSGAGAPGKDPAPDNI